MSHLIAIVDDDASILRALRRLLATTGLAVTTFASGEELLDSDDLDRIDCLVLDIHLGGLSGFQVQERLTASGRSIPTVFITAHDDDTTRERAHRVPASQYIRKPFDEQALVRAITTLLRTV